MGLLNKLNAGDTKLKSLRFGNDRPDGGDSEQPFIVTQPPVNLKPNVVDFIYRGGDSADELSVIDKRRISNFFDTAQGRLFIQKQQILSQISPKTEASVTYGKYNGGTYSENSTLDQVLNLYKGDHLNKQGTPPSSLITYQNTVVENANPSNNTYGYNPSNNSFKNRLLNLWSTKVAEISSFTFSPNVSSFGAPSSPASVIYEYDGGPNSDVDGLGTTYIKFATTNDGATPLRTGINRIIPDANTTLLTFQQILDDYYIKTINGEIKKPLGVSNIWEKLFSSEKYTLDVGLKSYELKYSETNNFNSIYLSGSLTPRSDLSQYLIGRKNNGSGPLQNPEYLPKSDNKPLALSNKLSGAQTTLKYDGYSYVISEDVNIYKSGSFTEARKDKYRTYTLEQITSRTLPGQKGISVYSPKKSDINMGDAGATRGSDSTAIDQINISNASDKNDYVKFQIAIINPTSPSSNLKSMQFRSFIDSVSDTYTSNWKEQSYLGRGEKFYKYSDFNREMSIAFKVVALSKAEMTPIYDKLNYLASSLAPSYTTSGYMTGNVAKVTLGNYIKNQYGIIKNLSYTFPEEATYDTAVELPIMIAVQMSFTPIHNFRPQPGKQFINQ